MLFSREAHRTDAHAGPVASYDEWVQLTGVDLQTPQEREAWEAGRPVKVKLPLLAARPRSVDQYQAEAKAAGFEFHEAHLPQDNSNWVSFWGRKPSRRA